jgi:hypothetical protein
VAEKQKAKLSSDATKAGWQLYHAQEAEITTDGLGNRVSIRQPNFVAMKRDPNIRGEAPVELAAHSPEALDKMIEDYENSRPLPANEQNPPPTPEQALVSGAATVHTLLSDGARQAREIRLTQPANPAEQPPDVRIETSPPMAVKNLDPDTGGADEVLAEGTLAEVQEDAKGAAKKGANPDKNK